MHRARTSDCAGRRTASSYSSWGRPWSRAKALAPCSPNVALSASVVDPSSTSVAEGATNSSTLLIVILSLVDWSGHPLMTFCSCCVRKVAKATMLLTRAAAEVPTASREWHRHSPQILVGLFNLRSLCPFELTPLSRGGAFPCLESPIEGIGIIITEQEGGLVDFNSGLGEILVRHFLPGLGQELAKCGAFIGDPPLQGARAHPKFLCYQKNVRVIAR